MLAELSEDEATGEIAHIYSEIRRLWAAPYVSSLQRNLATKFGWLEWTWSAIGPAFSSGTAQRAGWEIAADLTLPELPLDRPALPHLDKVDVQAIGDICANFVRVAPVNLMFAGLLRQLLLGLTPYGPGWPSVIWSPPEILPVLPAMVDIATIPADLQACLMKLGTEVDGEPFVPGLYRILARWPQFIDYLSIALPYLEVAPETEAARLTLLAEIDAAVEAVFAQLPALGSPKMPAPHFREDILATLETYRRTSPEMVIFGKAISVVVKTEM